MEIGTSHFHSLVFSLNSPSSDFKFLNFFVSYQTLYFNTKLINQVFNHILFTIHFQVYNKSKLQLYKLLIQQ